MMRSTPVVDFAFKYGFEECDTVSVANVKVTTAVPSAVIAAGSFLLSVLSCA
jgi:hypothetical protein